MAPCKSSFSISRPIIFSHRYLRLLFSQPAVLQVTTLLNLAGVAHVVDATSADLYTKSVLIRLLALRTVPSIGPHGEQSQTLPSYVLRE